jgi:hypothetical protein
MELTWTIETIELTDDDLRASWGRQIFRVLLKSPEPFFRTQPLGAKGKCTYTFSRA